MRKLWIMSLLILLTVVGCRAQVATQAASIALKDFSVGNIYLGQPFVEVTQIYGKPLKKVESLLDPGIYERCLFPGFEIEVPSFEAVKRVFFVTVKRSGMKTPRGIEVGNSSSDVLRKYGKPRFKSPDGLHILYDIDVTDDIGLVDTHTLQFTLASSKVKEIRLYYASQD